MRRLLSLAAVVLTLGIVPAALTGQVQAQPAVPAPEARNLNELVAEAMTDARMVLGSIGNPSSAEDAAPRLQELRARLEALRSRIEGAPMEARSGLRELVNRDMPQIRGLADRILDLQGTEPVRGDIQAIVAQLQSWAG